MSLMHTDWVSSKPQVLASLEAQEPKKQLKDRVMQGTRLILRTYYGLDLWLQVQIFYDHVDYTTQVAIDYATGKRLRKLRLKEAWETIEDFTQHEEEEWNDLIFFDKESLDYIDATLEQELESMEC
nr:zinc finger, CCHC-type [Tanacetum cinerariifolium]